MTMTMQSAIPVTNWVSYREPLEPWGSTFSTNELVEQIATTKDTTDYLWYTTNVEVAESDAPNGLAQATLVMSYLRDAAHIFVNKAQRAPMVPRLVSQSACDLELTALRYSL